jgi:hypothetical protein
MIKGSRYTWKYYTKYYTKNGVGQILHLKKCQSGSVTLNVLVLYKPFEDLMDLAVFYLLFLLPPTIKKHMSCDCFKSDRKMYSVSYLFLNFLWCWIYEL